MQINRGKAADSITHTCKLRKSWWIVLKRQVRCSSGYYWCIESFVEYCTRNNCCLYVSERTPTHVIVHNTSEFKKRLVPHLPYIPDLAPADFYLFRTIKENLHGFRFMTCMPLNYFKIIGQYTKSWISQKLAWYLV